MLQVTSVRGGDLAATGERQGCRPVGPMVNLGPETSLSEVWRPKNDRSRSRVAASPIPPEP
jgi:hypothetical protein